MKRLMLVIGLTFVAAAVVIPAVAQAAEAPKKLDVMLYVDTVNGTRPAAGTRPRPVGCTQTNTFTRGEQQVFRIWGTISGSGEILASDNVNYAYVTVPGTPNLKLNWGPHGPTTNRVWFWTAAWLIPADAPLGESTAKIVFKTDDGAFGIYEYKYTVVPQLSTAAKKKKTTSAKSR